MSTLWLQPAFVILAGLGFGFWAVSRFSGQVLRLVVTLGVALLVGAILLLTQVPLSHALFLLPLCGGGAALAVFLARMPRSAIMEELARRD